MKSDKIGYIATAITAVLTELQIEEIFSYVSLVITILIGVSTLALNIMKWHQAAIADKKVTSEEVEELMHEVHNSLEEIKNDIEGKKK